MELFESKLAFHTQQLQEAIVKLAQFVVRTLSGPHDRLLHEVPPFGVTLYIPHRLFFFLVWIRIYRNYGKKW